MKFNDFIVSEEKVRLDPKCWTGKKIGNPKTKVKGGVRVNNCVPAESVEEAVNPAQQAAIAIAKKKKAGVKEAFNPVNEGMPADNDMGATPSGAKMTLGQWKQMWMKKMPNADFAAMFRSPPNMQGSAIAYFDGWMNNPDARWDPQQGMTEGSQRVDSLVTDALKIMRGSEASDAVAALKTVLGDREYNSRRGYYNFYVRQLLDMSGQQGMTEADITRRGFLQGAGAAAVGAGAGYNLAPMQQLGAKTKNLSAADIKTIDEYLTYYSLTKWRKTSPDSQFYIHQMLEPAIQKFIKNYGQEGKDLLNARFKVVNLKLSSLSPQEFEALYKSYDKIGSDNKYKHNTITLQFNRLLDELDESVNQGVAEGFNGEYDDEAGMADNNLETLRRAVDGIDDVINTGDNLPEWCQEKIAVAKSMLVTVWDYMRSEEEIADPEIEEMYEAMDQLAEEMAAKKGISADLVWETFESLPDNMLYETAAWRRKEGKSAKGGLNAKGVASYRRENPGSKLQTAVTTKPSKLKAGSKAAKRRKSFCARMSGVKGPAKKPNGEPTRKTLALRKWNC